ncbi:MAG: enoyl-CoA hydratase/isomerase family protein [bacterium]
MSSPNLLVQKNDGLLRVTLNRPEKRNALSRDLLGQLRETFEGHRGDDALKAAVLTGAGDKSFAAGGDLRDLDGIRSHGAAVEMAEQAKEALDSIRSFPVPVVAALNGNALGGGAELAMACDFRVAAAHARIGFVQGRLNITSAWGGGVDLMRRIGPDRALALLCRGDLLDGAQARGEGLLDAACEAGESLESALEAFLAPFLRMAPQVLRGFKALALGARAGLSRAELDKLETELFAPTWVHEDHWAAAEKILTPKG